MRATIEDEESPISYVGKFREYGLQVLDGGSSHIEIDFCPWCGSKLPGSLRDDWFDELERLGIDPYDDEVPEEFTDERWYAERSSESESKPKPGSAEQA